jgi:hypothetical protein
MVLEFYSLSNTLLLRWILRTDGWCLRKVTWWRKEAVDGSARESITHRLAL